MKENTQSHVITNIGLGIAAIIAGGFGIYQLSSLIPIPGMKFIFMAPFMSMMFYILIARVKIKASVIIIGTVFGGIMSIVSIFMGLSIFLSAAFAQLLALPFPIGDQQAAIGSVTFATASGAISLLITKLFVKGIYEIITLPQIGLLMVLCLIFGILGAYLGSVITKYLRHL